MEYILCVSRITGTFILFKLFLSSMYILFGTIVYYWKPLHLSIFGLLKFVVRLLGTVGYLGYFLLTYMSSNFLTIWWDLPINLAPKWSSGKRKIMCNPDFKSGFILRRWLRYTQKQKYQQKSCWRSVETDEWLSLLSWQLWP